MNPRILFVSHTAALGGAELSLLGIMPHFGERARLLAFEDGPLVERAAAAGIDVAVAGNGRALGVRRNSGLLRSLAAAPQLMPLIGRVARDLRGVDVVYANTQKSLVVAALASQFVRKPLVWHLHDILTADHFSGAMRQTAVRLGNARAGRVICNSEATGQAFVKAGGRGGIARIVYNGIDEQPFTEPTGDESAAEDALAGLERPIIGVFGRLAPWKGQHVAIWALKVFGRGSMVIVGDALFGEAAYREKLEAQVKEQHLTRRVRFLGQRDDVAALMRRVDVVAHTSIAPEPFGRVIVEAMLAGKPVIAADAGGPAEIVENGVSGILVPPNSPRLLAEALARVTRDPTYCIKLGRQGRDWARWNFTASRINPQIEAVVREALPAQSVAISTA